MRTVGLISGGKDSCFNMLQCIAAGHEIVALANLHPPKYDNAECKTLELDEMDSYMYQTVGHDAISLYSEATGLPLYREVIQGSSLQQGSDYTFNCNEDEVEDLYRLLARVKEAETVEAVSVGAILSNYQRVRVENVCQRLGLTCLSYLWQRNQEELLEEMIVSGVNAVLIKVAALGLHPQKHLGKSIQDCHHDLIELKEKFGLNVCGEGGEYETLTLDCPFFKKRIVLDEVELVPHSKDPFAPVAYLRFPKLSLAEKESDLRQNWEVIREPRDFCRKELENSDKVDLLTQCTDTFPEENCMDVPIEEDDPTSLESMIFIGGLKAETEANFLDMMHIFQNNTEAQGSSMGAVLAVCLYIRDMSDYPLINKIYSQFFGLNPPVRVCVQAPLSCFAMLEAIASSSANCKRSMHVQSVSHWAPANIGPYSQCVQKGDLFLVSGQIGLIPGSMVLPEPVNFVSECRLALRHVTRVLLAMDKDMCLTNALQVICFVREEIHILSAKAIWKEYGGDVNHPIAFVVTSNLPRNALVEWQVWAHRAKASTEKLAARVSLSKQLGYMLITKRKEAISFICKLNDIPIDKDEWETFYRMIKTKLRKTHGLKIFYKNDIDSSGLQILKELISEAIALTVIPVCGFESGVMAIVCGSSIYC